MLQVAGEANLSAVGLRRRYTVVLRSRILILLSITECLDSACSKLSELLQGGRRIGKEIEVGSWIPAHLNGSIVDAIIHPMGRDVQGLGHLRQGERARHLAGMGLMADLKDPMTQAQEFDG